MISQVTTAGKVGVAADGLPVLELGRRVTNDEVLAAVDRERSER